MKPARRIVLPSLAALLAAGAASCARPAPRVAHHEVAPAPARSPLFESSVPEVAPLQRRAQQAWCSYLEALYVRAGGTAWPERARCNAHDSTASPEMLEKTAACSKRALDEYPGDPFSDGYAAEVRQCGATVLESLALTPEEVSPYIAAACEGSSMPDDCRAGVTSRLGHRIARAVGALNAESRLRLRACLQAPRGGGGDVDEHIQRIDGCLEPMLDQLLWTPD